MLNLGLAVVIAQLVESRLESLYFFHRVGYPVEPDRTIAFFQCVGAGLLAYASFFMVRRVMPSARA